MTQATLPGVVDQHRLGLAFHGTVEALADFQQALDHADYPMTVGIYQQLRALSDKFQIITDRAGRQVDALLQER